MSEINNHQINLSFYRSPKTLVSRFVARQSIRNASIWAIIIVIYVASKAIGFGKLYSTTEARVKFAATLGNNIGLNALIGQPHDVTSVAGYTAWNTIGVVVFVLAIWGLLLATKTLRGAEDSGRWEILLAGQTNTKKALINALGGMYAALFLLYIILAAGFIFIGKSHYVGYSAPQALYFALTAALIGAIFISLGALTSQLMANRTKAAGLGLGIFGIFFLTRAAGDITTQHWLLDLSPLGWIEKLQPLTNTQPVWLVPILLSTVILCSLSIFLASKRDIDDSIIKDKPESKPRTKLLNGLIPSGIRLTYLNSLCWIAGLTIMGLFYGVLTKSASQALSQSASTTKAFNKIIHYNAYSLSNLYLGIAFLIFIVIVMGYCASAVSRLREDEAVGYLDNIFVLPVKRFAWLNGRALIIAVVAIIAVACGGLASYLGAISQHASISSHSILLASLNACVPAMFTIGLAVFAYGYIPRLTSVIGYGLIGWSFLIEMLAYGVNLSHWVMDTSLLSHIALAPAATIDWRTNYVILGLAVLLFAAGCFRFNQRDLVNE